MSRATAVAQTVDTHLHAAPPVDASFLLDVTRPAGRPIRVGVISNPQSGRNARKGFLQRVRDLLKEHPTVPGLEADSLETILTGTRELIDRGAEVIVLNGGDGTVSAALTATFREPQGRVPIFAVLPGGTTNCTARCVGFGGDPNTALREILNGAAAGRLNATVLPNPVLRVDIEDHADPYFAMFFGGGAVFHGTLLYKRQVESRGFRGELGAGITLATFIFNIVLGRGRELFPPGSVIGNADGKPLPEVPNLGMLISTMNEQFGGIKPYWGKEPAPVRCTTLDYGPRNVLRALPVLRTGIPNRHTVPENGFRSFNAFEIALDMDTGFAIDGELFEKAGRMRVNLSAYNKAFFLRRRATK